MRKFILIIDGSNRRRLFELRRVSYKIKGNALHFDTGRGNPEIFSAVCEDNAKAKEAFLIWFDYELFNFIKSEKESYYVMCQSKLKNLFQDRLKNRGDAPLWSSEMAEGFRSAVYSAENGDL